jgi:3-hydroxyacyl-CoA dehydrogenase
VCLLPLSFFFFAAISHPSIVFQTQTKAKRFNTEEDFQSSGAGADSGQHRVVQPVSVAIIGGGLVGCSLAVVFARAGNTVRVWEADQNVRGTVEMRVSDTVKDLFAAGLLSKFGVGSVEEVTGRISVTESLSEALEGSAWVQECVPEKVDVKRKVFTAVSQEISALVERSPELADWAARIVIASSTSALPPSSFTSDLPHSSRCVVAHPVNPPHLIPCVEIVPAPKTDPDVVSTAKNFMEDLGQAPVILSREVHSFVLNRLQGAVLNEAMKLVDEGLVSPNDIDTTVREGLGLRWSFMGPFETIDLNAPGGVADYAARYGGSMFELAQEQAGAFWGLAVSLFVVVDTTFSGVLDFPSCISVE